jgi:PAS domain S-box-containing protein
MWDMGRHWAVAALIMLMCLATGRAQADLVRLDPGMTRVPLAGHLEVLRDPSQQMTLEEVMRPEAAARFSPLDSDLVAGYDRSAFWLRIRVERQTSGHWLLEVGLPYLDHLTLYVPDNHGGFRADATGDRTPFSTRPLSYRTFVFKPDPPFGQEQVLYLRVQTTSTVTVAPIFWHDDAFAAHAAFEGLLLGLLNGSGLAIAFFTLFKFALTRDRLYLYCFAYVLAATMSYFSLAGLASQYIFPSMPMIGDGAIGFFIAVSLGIGSLFVARVLDLANWYPRWNIAFRLVGYLVMACALTPFFDVWYRAAPVVNSMAAVMLVACTIASLRMAWVGDPVARYFATSFSIYSLVVLALTLRTLGLMPAPMSINLAAQAMAVPHMLLLSLGLLHRSADIDDLHLELVRRSERQMERRVAQRTVELAQVNATLAAEVGERRAAEAKIRESERQLRAILDAAPFPIVVAAFPAGDVLFANQSVLDLLEVERDKVLGRKTGEFYEDISERDGFMAQLAERGVILNADMRIRSDRGQVRWVLMSSVRFTYGESDAVLICLNDISIRKQLEQQLREANLRSEEALEAGRQSMREQRNFLSMVSHEFRVPLAIIEAASQLLGIYSRDDGEALDEVAKISRAVRRMADLMDICLADDRLESASLTLSPQPVEMVKVLRDLCDDKRPLAGARQLVLQADGPLGITADPTLLRIAFSNLIDNALKFSPAETRVEIRAMIDGDGLMVSVRDNGPGIALEEQPRIFEKFYRSTKADRVRGGGLGLYIVRRIVELHDGCVAVDSRPGKGATFVVWLPVIQG